MRRTLRQLVPLFMLAVAAMGCNLYPGVLATPTLIPTLPTRPVTVTVTPTPTALASATSTPTTPTLVAVIPTKTAPATATAMPSATASLTATLTATTTATMSPTMISTVTPSVTPSLTQVPATNSVPTVTATLPPARPTIRPVTFTPLPANLFATVTPIASSTSAPVVVVVLPSPMVVVITSTPLTPTLLPPRPTTAPTVALAQAVTFAAPSLAVTVNANLATIEEGVLQIPSEDTPPVVASISTSFDISRNGQRAQINANGQLLINGNAYVGDFGKHARQQFTSVSWSPDGRWLAYSVKTPNAESGTLPFTTTIDDGVWVLDTQSANALPRQVFRANYYQASNEFPYRIPIKIEWANDNYAMLITIQTVRGLSTVLAGVGGEDQVFDAREPTWLVDSSGFVTTTLPPTPTGSPVTLVQTDRNGKTQALLDGARAGLWIQNPAQVAGGGYAFLGKPLSQAGSGATDLRLYLFLPGTAPVPISDPLLGEVISAEWNPGRTAILVQVRQADGRVETWVATLNRQLLNVTTQTNGRAGTRWQR